MAPLLASRASSTSTALPDDKIEVWSDAVYNRAQEDEADRKFTHEDLLGFGIVSDLKQLLPVVNRLVSEFLFKPWKNSEGQSFWTWRTQEDAKKFLLIPSLEFRNIYGLVEDVGREGVWARSIRYRAQSSEGTVKSALKWLENKGLISEFKSAEYPHRKMYILSSLRPSERATGGPWFTDDKLDQGLLNAMQKLVFKLIKDRSSYFSAKLTPGSAAAKVNGNGTGRKKQPLKGTMHGVSPRGKKRSSDEISGTNPFASTGSGPVRRGPQIMSLPSGYTPYPTVLEIARQVSQGGVTKDPLSQSDIQQIVDILVWDSRLEIVSLPGGQKGYRVTGPAEILATDDPKEENDDVLGAAQELRLTGISDMPCGNCPVADICQPGTQVSPEKCDYYQEWAKFLD